MRKLIKIFLPILLIGIFTLEADAQHMPRYYYELLEKERKEEQRRLAEQEKEAFYYEAINSGSIERYKDFIKKYPKDKRYTPEIKRRLTEKNLWKEATEKNTIESYEKYLKKTVLGWYTDNANERIQNIKDEQEKAVWESADKLGTIAAYEEYIKNNPQTKYVPEARTKIRVIQAAQEWDAIKNSENVDTIKSYIKKYPYEAQTPTAKKLVHELKGYEYYKNNDLLAAYDEFSQISINDVDSSRKYAYKASKEYYEFKQLSEESPESDLHYFLNIYPYSVYKADVNNFIALNKAKKFDENSTEINYQEALSYAQNDSTKSIVNASIEENNQYIIEYKKAVKKRERAANGGWVNLGITVGDIGYNLKSGQNAKFYYNAGLLFGVGNYKDWIQFSVGLKAGVLLYDKRLKIGDTNPPLETIGTRGYDEPEESESYISASFHLPAMAQLKINLFKSGIFLMGRYEYNIVRDSNLEAPMAWTAGVGIGGRFLELSLFYRQDIGAPKVYDNDSNGFLGLSLTYNIGF